MATEYTIELREGVIEVHVTGVPDRASIAKMWHDIAAACKEEHCFSILGVSRLETPLKIADAIDHQAIFLEAGISIDHRIAWVQLNPEAYAMTQLAETILLNRGLANGRLFDDECAARHWLMDRPVS